jgi:hypothetical protein
VDGGALQSPKYDVLQSDSATLLFTTLIFGYNCICRRLCDGGDAVDGDGGTAQCVMYALLRLATAALLHTDVHLSNQTACCVACRRLCDGGNAVDVDGGTAQCVMYARIATMDQELPSDMTDYWQEPASYFLLKGACYANSVVMCLSFRSGPGSLRQDRVLAGACLLFPAQRWAPLNHN